MSYNESLRSNSNYPHMSQSEWDAAPFNEPRIPERDFDVNVEVTLQRRDTITTDDYYPEFDEEDGHTYANTDNTDWNTAYESSAYTIEYLLKMLKKYVEMDMAVSGKSRRLVELLKACEGWKVVETNVEEA